MLKVWDIYLVYNFAFSLLLFLLAIWISRTAPSSSAQKSLVVSGKSIILALLIINILTNIVLLTRNIPPRLQANVVGDGLCDYTGRPATLGLFEVIRGTTYVDGQQQRFISYDVRAITDIRNDKLVTEYAPSLEWLAILDKERMSNGWLIKTVILVGSIALLIIAAAFNGVFEKHRATLQQTTS
jgi:hypothetical protein